MRSSREEKLIQYFKDNIKEFNELVRDRMSCDDWNSDNEKFPMSELCEVVRHDSDEDVMRLLDMAFFGSDDDTQNGSFNPTKDYFYFNGYGNLVSTSNEDYYDLIDDMARDLVNNDLDDWKPVLSYDVKAILNEPEVE